MTAPSEESFISVPPLTGTFVFLNENIRARKKRTTEAEGKGENYEVFIDLTQCVQKKYNTSYIYKYVINIYKHEIKIFLVVISKKQKETSHIKKAKRDKQN